MQRSLKIAGSIVGVILFILGLAGTPDDVTRWKEWLKLLENLLFLNLGQTLLVVVGLFVIAAANAPRRFWEYVRERLRIGPSLVMKCQEFQQWPETSGQGFFPLVVLLTFRPSRPMQLARLALVIECDPNHRVDALLPTKFIEGIESHDVTFFIPTDITKDSPSAHVEALAGGLWWITDRFRIFATKPIPDTEGSQS